MQIQHAYCSEDPLALSWHPGEHTVARLAGWAGPPPDGLPVVARRIYGTRRQAHHRRRPRQPAGHRDRLVIPGEPIANVLGPRAPCAATSLRISLSRRCLDGVAAVACDQCDHGVERGFERLGVALDLSQQQAALEGGEGGEGELVGIGLGGEPAELVHLP